MPDRSYTTFTNITSAYVSHCVISVERNYMARFRLLSNAMIQHNTRVIILRSLFWAGIIVLAVVSVVPRDVLPPLGFNMWDKFQHILAYAILSFFGGMAYPGKKCFIVIFLGLVVLGGVLEVIQSFVPNREARIADTVANTIGAVTGLFITQYLRNSRVPGDGGTR